MEPTLRSSVCTPLRKEALATFEAVLKDVHAQYLSMQSALHYANLLPLDSSDQIASFLDARDELAAQMQALGESLFHALTTGHQASVADLLSTWPTAGIRASLPFTREPHPSSEHSPPHPRAVPHAPEATPRANSEADSATSHLGLVTISPELDAPLAPTLHVQAAERLEAAASFRASSAEAIGVDARIGSPRPVDPNEALGEVLNGALGEALDAAPSPPAPKTEELGPFKNATLPLSKSGATAIANGALPNAGTIEPPTPQEPGQAARSRFTTVVADRDDALRPTQRADLASLIKAKEPRQVLADVTLAPPSPLATIDDAKLERLKEGIKGKGFGKEQMLSELETKHYFCEDSDMTEAQFDHLLKALRQLPRPPSGTISNFPSYVGSLRRFVNEENLAAFAELSKGLCLSVMEVCTAYFRFLQERDTRRDFTEENQALRADILAFMKTFDPGFAHGLRSEDTPDRGAWADAALYRLTELESKVDGHLQKLQKARAGSGQAKRERQSKIDREFNTIERLIESMNKRAQLADQRAALEGGMADRVRKDLAPPTATSRKPARNLRKPEALVHGVTKDEDTQFRSEDLERIKLACERLLAVDCRVDHPRLLRAVSKLKGELDFSATLAPVLQALVDSEQEKELAVQEDEEATKVWPFRAKYTEGKKAFIVGGNRNAKAEKRIQDHFGFADVTWHDTKRNKGSARMSAIKRGMSVGQYDFYIAIENLVAHMWSDMIFDAEAADHVQPVLVSGYGVRAIERELQRTMRLDEATL